MITESDIKQIAALVAEQITPLLIRKRWLSLREAAGEFGIGEHRLKHLATAGIIKGFQDPDSKRGDWIFDRQSLDAYRERQSGTKASLEEKVLELSRRVSL